MLSGKNLVSNRYFGESHTMNNSEIEAKNTRHDVRGAIATLKNMIFLMDAGVDMNGPVKEPLKEEITEIINLLERKFVAS